MMSINEDGPQRPKWVRQEFTSSLGLGDVLHQKVTAKMSPSEQASAESQQVDEQSSLDSGEAIGNSMATAEQKEEFDPNFDNLSQTQSKTFDMSGIDNLSQDGGLGATAEPDCSAIDALSSDNMNELLIPDHSNWQGHEVEDVSGGGRSTGIYETGHPNEQHILPDIYDNKEEDSSLEA